MPTYQSTNPLARTSPLRSIPLFRPASILLRAAAPVYPPMAEPVFEHGCAPPPPPSAHDLLVHELACAEAALREIVRVYDFARKEIGEANRTHTEAVMVGAHVVIAAKPFTKERIGERKSAAFRLFNQRRGELCAGRRRVDAARRALGMPNLAIVEDHKAIAARAHQQAARRSPDRSADRPRTACSGHAGSLTPSQSSPLLAAASSGRQTVAGRLPA